MTSRPHDALFKRAFEGPAGAAALLRHLLPPSVRDAIAWDTLDHDLGSFVDVRLADRHGDLLFSAQLRAGAPDVVYLLLEHQSTLDPSMPLRVLSSQLQIWNRFRNEHPRIPLPPVIGVLVSHAPGGWDGPRSFHELLDPGVIAIPDLAALVPRFSLVDLDLTPLSNADLVARALPPFQTLALWMLRDARDQVRLLGSLGGRGPMVEAGLTRLASDELAALVHYLFEIIDPVYRDELRAKLCELSNHSEEAAMSIADYYREEGRQEAKEAARSIAESYREEGRQEALRKGHEEGVLASLRKLLLLKFQALDPESEARLRAASPQEIDRYLQRLLTADSLAAVFED